MAEISRSYPIRSIAQKYHLSYADALLFVDVMLAGKSVLGHI
jgi:hypothetical protein